MTNGVPREPVMPPLRLEDGWGVSLGYVVEPEDAVEIEKMYGIKQCKSCQKWWGPERYREYSSSCIQCLHERDNPSLLKRFKSMFNLKPSLGGYQPETHYSLNKETATPPTSRTKTNKLESNEISYIFTTVDNDVIHFTDLDQLISNKYFSLLIKVFGTRNLCRSKDCLFLHIPNVFEKGSVIPLGMVDDPSGIDELVPLHFIPAEKDIIDFEGRNPKLPMFTSLPKPPSVPGKSIDQVVQSYWPWVGRHNITGRYNPLLGKPRKGLEVFEVYKTQLDQAKTPKALSGIDAEIGFRTGIYKEYPELAWRGFLRWLSPLSDLSDLYERYSYLENDGCTYLDRLLRSSDSRLTETIEDVFVAIASSLNLSLLITPINSKEASNAGNNDMFNKSMTEFKMDGLTDKDILTIAANLETCPVTPWQLAADVKVGDVREQTLRFARAVIEAHEQRKNQNAGE